MSDQENMEFLVVLLFATCVYLWLKGKSYKSSLRRIKSQSPIDSESLKTDSALSSELPLLQWRSRGLAPTQSGLGRLDG